MTRSAARADWFARMAVDQCGLLHRDQLRKLGVDADQVRNHVRAGRWSLLGCNVVALQTGPLSAEQQAWYAVLDGGRHCVITGLSALHRYGLSGFPVDRV
jgi:hypothetical protein